MQEAALLVLAVLAAGSQHGGGIITGVRQISGGRVRLRAGTLYSALDGLRAAGLVEVEREGIAGNRPCRYYRLTACHLLAAARVSQRPDHDHADLRIGDADRDATAAILSEHFAQGRLTLDELTERLDAAFTATTRRELSRATRDLPRDCLAMHMTAPRNAHERPHGSSSPVPDEDTGLRIRHNPLM